jgi:hypothetical protein
MDALTKEFSMLRRIGLLLSLLIASAPLLAHSELPHPVWCEGGTMVEVARFQFGPDALPPSSSTTCPSDPKSGSVAKNCGQFDDDYRGAHDTGQRYCHGFERQWQLGEVPDAGSVIMVVTSPETFLRATHHADYAVSQGLEGVCLRCEGRLAEPIRPRSSTRDGN